MKEHCRFCQADLEQGTQCCGQYGHIQQVPLTSAPTQLEASTDLLSQAPRQQDAEEVTVATTHQEGTDAAAAQAPLSEQQDSPSAQGTTTENPEAVPSSVAVAEAESHPPEESAPEAKSGDNMEEEEDE
jgi:hypothetical protein